MSKINCSGWREQFPAPTFPRSARIPLPLLPRLLLVVLGIIAVSLSAGAAENRIRALILVGPDNRVHHWGENAVAISDALKQDARFEVTTETNLALLASLKLDQYSVVIFQFNNRLPPETDAPARTNLLNYIEQGGGLVIVHIASGAFPDWPEYRNLIGRIQKLRHDTRGPFLVRIKDADHPVTRGLKDFEADDELFIELTGEAPIQLLATATSNITHEDHPMAFALTRGKGRVFHTTLGHDARALRIAGTAELIRRGTTWAAGAESDPSFLHQP